MIFITLACALFYLSSANRLLLQYGNVYNQYPQYNPYQNYNPYQTYNPYQQQQYNPYPQYNPYQQQYNPQPQLQPYPNTNPAQQLPNTPAQTPPVSPQTPPATNTPPASGTAQTPPVSGTPPVLTTPGYPSNQPPAGTVLTPGFPSNQPQPVTPPGSATPPVPFGRAIYPGGQPGIAIGGFVPPMAELICDQPAGMIGSCANGRTTISNVIDQFKMNCNAMGSCQNADITMNLNGMGVRAVEGIWCSEPGSCAGANLKLRNTAGGNNIELSRLECSGIGSCNGMTIDVMGISVNDLDCPQPENCMGCTVIDRMDFPPVPKPCFGW